MKKRIICTFLWVFTLLLLSPWEEVCAQGGTAYRRSPITLHVNDRPLKNVLDTLAQVANVHFFYNHSQVAVDKKVSVNVDNKTLEDVVKNLVAGMDLDVSFELNRTVVLKPAMKRVEGVPTLKVKGKVVDATTGEPLVGATVVLVNNKMMGVVADLDGNFEIDLPHGATALEISFIGYQTETLALQQLDLNKDIVVKMSQMTTEMDAVVVTGMAPRKVEGFTGGYVSVKGEELKKLSPGNLLKALQLFDPSFRIVENNKRGSDPNTMPEFQLRGDAQLGDFSSSSMNMLLGDYSNSPNMPLFILDGFESTLQRIMDLDPERVESITILKDASATAIYGSRAANGVVVFETKKPLPGALNIFYSSNYSVQVPDLTDYNLMRAEEKLEYEKASGLFGDRPELLNYYNQKREEILRGVDTYWLSEPVRIGFSHRQHVSAEGGDDAFRYNLSLNYNGENGVMKGSDRTNYGMDIALSYRRKKWNVRNTFSMQQTKSNNSPYGSFSTYATLNPYYRKTDENGNYQKVIEKKFTGSSYEDIPNPLYNIQFAFKDNSKNFSLTNNFAIECAILENLRLSADVSFTKTSGESDQFKSSNHTDFETQKTPLAERGTYNKSWANGFSWTANAQISYNWVKDAHNLSFMGRYNISESISSGVNLAAKGFPNDNMTDLMFAYDITKKENQINVGQESKSRSLGVIASLSYMYDYRYAMDASIRGDLASQFGSNTGMAPFWSLGVRWNLHRESFLEGSIVSNLVLRANLGTTGSQNYSPYMSKETYSFSGLLFPYTSSDVLGAQLMALGNPNLGWSTTQNRSIALDFGLWQNRFSGSFSYYNNYTDELLLDYNIAPSSGFTTVMNNVGSVLNEGYEVMLSVTPINDYERNIQWMVSVNGSYNRNIIKKISNELEELNKANMNKSSAPEPIYQEGKSTSTLFAVRSLGIDPMTGQEIFLKKDGTRTFIWDPVDKVDCGDTQPKLQGSLSTSFIWKNLSIALGCTYQFGADRYNNTLVDKIENAPVGYNVDRRAFEDRWEKPGDIAKYKKISYNSANTPASDRFIEKFHEFKFSTLSIDYRFEADKYKLLNKLNIASINVSTAFEDLGRISTVKEERGTDYPFARVFNLSLSVLFN